MINTLYCVLEISLVCTVHNYCFNEHHDSYVSVCACVCMERGQSMFVSQQHSKYRAICHFFPFCQDLEMLADLALTLTILRCFTLLGKYVSCGGGEGKEGGRRGENMGNMQE